MLERTHGSVRLSVAACTSASGESGAVLGVSIMIRVANVTSPIPRFIRLKMRKGRGSTRRQRPAISVVRIVAVIDVAIEAARSMEPWACADEDAADKPVRTVITVGRAVIRRVVEVTVWTDGRRPDVYTYADLRRCMRGDSAKETEECYQNKRSKRSHDSPRVKLISEKNRCRNEEMGMRLEREFVKESFAGFAFRRLDDPVERGLNGPDLVCWLTGTLRQ